MLSVNHHISLGSILFDFTLGAVIKENPSFMPVVVLVEFHHDALPK